jgi:energy-converting hydrogenase Eha subunit A
MRRPHGATVGTVGHAAVVAAPAHSQHASKGPSAWRFLRHLGEMVLAMWVGMALFGGLRAVLAGTGPGDALSDHFNFRLVAMALFMAAPMVALMRVRGHSWERAAEMAAAMVVPVLAVCLVAHVTDLSDAAVSASSHVLMYVGMLGVMLARYPEYAHAGPHTSAAHA